MKKTQQKLTAFVSMQWLFNNECEIFILAWKSFSFYLFFQTFMEFCTVHTVLLMSSIFPKFLIHFEFISVSGVFFLGSLSFSFSFIRASENNFLLIFHWNESYRRFIQHNSSKYFSSFHSLHLCHEHLDFRFYYYSTDHALCILRMTLLQVHVIWNLFGDSVSYLENWTSVAGAKINGKSNEQVQNLKKIP